MVKPLQNLEMYLVHFDLFTQEMSYENDHCFEFALKWNVLDRNLATYVIIYEK